jgi:hypothetical protein
LFPVFLDQDEVEASPSLSAKLTSALTNSNSLIVICSPSAVASKWVNQEISQFKALGRADRIFCVIVDGDPGADASTDERACFSAELMKCGADRDIGGNSRGEPLAVDVRPGKESKQNALLRLVAGVVGISYDDLRRRDVRRQKRQRRAFLATSLLFVTTFAVSYLLLADAGYQFYGAQGIRNTVDRYDISLLRPAESCLSIDQTSQRLRGSLTAKLLSQQDRGDWQCRYVAYPDGSRTGIDVWTSSQALTAVLRAPVSRTQLSTCLATLDKAFVAGLPVEVNNVPYGWLPAHTSYAQAEPALWLISALSVTLRQQAASLTEDERQRLTKHLAYAQRAVSQYFGDNGAWYLTGGTKRPSTPSTYTAAVAMIALLEVHAAHQSWEGSQQRLDQLLHATANWLVRNYHPSEGGWHGTVNKIDHQINFGLTLQIYTQLLRARRQKAIDIPAGMLADIKDLLISLESRQYGYPATMIRPTLEFRDHQDQPRIEIVTINCLWHPWAVACAAEWLTSPMAQRVLPEERLRVRRALGNLLVKDEPKILSHLVNTENKRTYVVAETLYGLSFVDLPPAIDD